MLRHRRIFMMTYAERKVNIKKALQINTCKAFYCGEAGIRTLGAQKAQRFSRPPRSTAPAPLLVASRKFNGKKN